MTYCFKTSYKPSLIGAILSLPFFVFRIRIYLFSNLISAFLMERASDTLRPVLYSNRSTAGTLSIVLFMWQSYILNLSLRLNSWSICLWVNMYGVKFHLAPPNPGNLGMKHSCP